MKKWCCFCMKHVRPQREEQRFMFVWRCPHCHFALELDYKEIGVRKVGQQRPIAQCRISNGQR